MTNTWQTPVAVLVVLLALAFLLRGAFSKRKKLGCSGGCACPTDRFKTELKKHHS